MPYQVYLLIWVLFANRFRQDGRAVLDRCSCRDTRDEHIDAVGLEHLADTPPMGYLETAGERSAPNWHLRRQTRGSCARQTANIVMLTEIVESQQSMTEYQWMLRRPI